MTGFQYLVSVKDWEEAECIFGKYRIDYIEKRVIFHWKIKI
jgi:hypothetical protein